MIANTSYMSSVFFNNTDLVNFLSSNYKYSLSFYDFITPKSVIAQTTFQFHHDMMVLMLWVLGFIVYFLITCVNLYKTETKVNINKNFYGFTYFKHKGITIEILWTLTPALILVTIAIPSFALLYSTGFYSEPELTFKAIGNQWYWKYEYAVSTSKGLDSFESFLLTINDDKIEKGRLLIPTNSMPVPAETNIRILVTSRDVLHSWAIPALAIKFDACPGRLNEGFIFITITGHIFGACSEICGVNHAFMPTGLRVLNRSSFF